MFKWKFTYNLRSIITVDLFDQTFQISKLFVLRFLRDTLRMTNSDNGNDRVIPMDSMKWMSKQKVPISKLYVYGK